MLSLYSDLSLLQRLILHKAASQRHSDSTGAVDQRDKAGATYRHSMGYLSAKISQLLMQQLTTHGLLTL